MLRNHEALDMIQSEIKAETEYANAVKAATSDEEYHAHVHALWWANNRISQLLQKIMETST